MLANPSAELSKNASWSWSNLSEIVNKIQNVKAFEDTFNSMNIIRFFRYPNPNMQSHLSKWSWCKMFENEFEKEKKCWVDKIAQRLKRGIAISAFPIELVVK